MEVQLLTEKFVTTYGGGTLILSNGDKINTKTIILTVGVTGNYVEGLPADCFAHLTG